MKSSALLTLMALALAAIGVAGFVAENSRKSDFAPDPPIRSTRDYQISFERTGCLGTCPAFVLLIQDDGTAQLRMRAFQDAPSDPYEPKILLYESRLSPERHAALIERIENGGFRRLKLDYSVMVTDNPSTTIAIDTPRGHWSTHVYAVPCKARGASWTASRRRELGITEFVPDIFCELSDRLDAIACDTYLHGARLGPHRDLKPFRPPHCRNRT